jgi:hypothetical protein
MLEEKDKRIALLEEKLEMKEAALNSQEKSLADACKVANELDDLCKKHISKVHELYLLDKQLGNENDLQKRKIAIFIDVVSLCKSCESDAKTKMKENDIPMKPKDGES